MASAFLPFWPKAAMAAYITDTNSAIIYTKALPTNGFTEVVAELQFDATFGANVATKFDLTPQISNDGINWDDQTAFTSVLANGTFPYNEVVKYSTIGAFMRMKCEITNNEGAAATLAPTPYIAASGRS